jgi:transcriptional regulator with PAS, ATPase and Fis domain
LLDEIGEISPKMQVQLLRVLQEGEIRRVGGSRPVPVDVRLLVATNRDLKAAVAEGRFRQDLLYRLEVLTIHVPPLRERKADIGALLNHFLALHSARLGRPIPTVAPGVGAQLEAYAFPGNVRELSHLIERALLLLREGVLTTRDLAIEDGAKDGTSSSPAFTEDWPTIAALSRRYIDRVLVYTGGNKTRAADVLGIDRRTLNRMFARERAALAAAQGGVADESILVDEDSSSEV